MSTKLVLLSALLLFAAASPVVKWLIEHGGGLGLTAPGAISFCNVLFVGNFCGGVVALFLIRPSQLVQELRSLSRPAWAYLGVNVVLAAVVPALFFTALSKTSITNAILLSRLEPVVFALVSMVWFGASVAPRQWVGYAIVLIAAVSLVLYQGDFRLMVGDGLVLIAAALQALSVAVSKKVLENTRREVLIFVRTFFSSLVFFVLAIVLYGFEHFGEAFGPGLWGVMTVYALVLVVAAQVAWYRALDHAPPSWISNGLMASPLLGILFAFLILGEVPSTDQFLVGGIILIGMSLTRERAEPEETPPEQTLIAR